MKNLIITRYTPKISGAEVYNFYLLSKLKDYKDISIQVLSNNAKFVQELEKIKINTHLHKIIIGEVGTKKEFLNALLVFPIYVTQVIYHVSKNKKNPSKNIVIMQSMTEKLFTTYILKALGYKIIWIEHGPVFATSRTKFVKEIFKYMSTQVDKIIAVSENTKLDLVTGGIKVEKIRVIYIGLDTKLFNKVEKGSLKLKIPSDCFVTGFVGTVGIEKGIIRFLDVASKVIQKNKKTHFLVVGDGPMLDESRSYAKELGIESKVIFTGNVLNPIYCISKLDLLFLPTEHLEGISIAILEAMSQGVAVYTKDIGGNSEIVNEKNGFLYSKYDLEVVTNTFLSIIKKQDLKKIGDNAKREVNKKFSSENYKQFYKLFNEV